MHHHTSLREHLVERAEHSHPVVFIPSNDPPLVEFAKIFAGTDFYSFDVNKHLLDEAIFTLYEVSTEIVRTEGAEPEIFLRHWAPVITAEDLRTGFHEGADSALWGHTPTDVMPEDERTAAMLLLVTTNYVHLSASREQSPPLVRGAINETTEEFRYVVLA